MPISLGTIDGLLRSLTSRAVAGLDPPVVVTSGVHPPPDDRVRLHWWLYAVRPEPYLRVHADPHAGALLVAEPVPLRLHYLLSCHGPRGGEVASAQRALGNVIQALHASALAGGAEPIGITMETLTTAELCSLWRAVQVPMQPAVAYEVGPVVLSGLA